MTSKLKSRKQKSNNSMLHSRSKLQKPFEDPSDLLESSKLPPMDHELEKLNSNGTYTNGHSAHERKPSDPIPPPGLTPSDRRSMVLLIFLYLLQGIPVGLGFGSIPFLLSSKLSYSQLGLFSLCTYPYSLKLIWSPVVDSFYFEKFGRRKSWIVPIQIIVGAMFWWMGRNVQQLIDQEIPPVNLLTTIFFLLVFFAATQDIAVDALALTLLSEPNLSYASTAQTIGLNTGYFMSFTVFLAFNSVEFSNKYFRSALNQSDVPILTLSNYFTFWAYGFWIITTYLAFFQDEPRSHTPHSTTSSTSLDTSLSLTSVYRLMFSILSLPQIRSLLLLHLICKFATAANDGVTSLKFIEKGIKKEDLALAVLIDFPVQILAGWAVGGWASGKGGALKPWILSQYARLAWSLLFTCLVAMIPEGGEISNAFFLVIIASTVGSGFAGTVQFVGISAFHTQIADPLIGGTYMTLLNTISNLGGTWPRYFVLKAVDTFTVSSCHINPGELTEVDVSMTECSSEHGKHVCESMGGKCVIESDGYYWVSGFCMIVGFGLLVAVIGPRVRRLSKLPNSAWKVKSSDLAALR